mgnify:CR=1 FL=1
MRIIKSLIFILALGMMQFSYAQTNKRARDLGLKIGFIKVGYHVSTLGLVTVLAEYPTAKQTNKAIAIFMYLFIIFQFIGAN